MIKLTINAIKKEAKNFSIAESNHNEPSIFGSTDGKAVGTYLEHKFQKYLERTYTFIKGNSASGIDFPDKNINTDIKVTSITQPQSSCPFKSARQKIYGLGYNLLVFVYEKIDDNKTRKSRLNILHTVFVDKERTGDYQLTTSILSIIDNNGNKDDLISLFFDKNLPIDEIAALNLAEEVLQHRPNVGYLTISNALQWRLQYGRIIEKAGIIDGIYRLK
ncbi:MAG: restriction endonuclease [Treponema sp.]|jgi:hypothetical protein|nr:restriction endonuclease [Treponema sp.]